MSESVWQDLQRVEVPVTSITQGTVGSVFVTRGRPFMALAISMFDLGGASSVVLTFEASWNQQQWFQVRKFDDSVVTVTLSADVSQSPAEDSEGWLKILQDTGSIPLAVPAPYWRVRINPTASPAAGTTLEYQLVAYSA